MGINEILDICRMGANL